MAQDNPVTIEDLFKLPGFGSAEAKRVILEVLVDQSPIRPLEIRVQTATGTITAYECTIERGWNKYAERKVDILMLKLDRRAPEVEVSRNRWRRPDRRVNRDDRREPSICSGLTESLSPDRSTSAP